LAFQYNIGYWASDSDLKKSSGKGGLDMLSIGSIWNEKMSIGIEQLDDHHKTILRLMLEVKAEVDGTKHSEDIHAILSALVSYAKYHFLAEERIMFEKGFPELEQQRTDHRWYVNRITEISASFNAKDETVFKQDFLEHLKNWFANHILTRDVLLRDYIQQNKQ
jgi:hemerythrin